MERLIGLEEAKWAQSVLKVRLGRPSWLRGIGLSRDARGSYRIKVNAATLEECPLSPDYKVGPVPIILDAVGDRKALSHESAPSNPPQASPQEEEGPPSSVTLVQR